MERAVATDHTRRVDPESILRLDMTHQQATLLRNLMDLRTRSDITEETPDSEYDLLRALTVLVDFTE